MNVYIHTSTDSYIFYEVNEIEGGNVRCDSKRTVTNIFLIFHA